VPCSAATPPQEASVGVQSTTAQVRPVCVSSSLRSATARGHLQLVRPQAFHHVLCHRPICFSSATHHALCVCAHVQQTAMLLWIGSH
jgi:hypothetical protein